MLGGLLWWSINVRRRLSVVRSQLTRNLIERSGATCRLKVTKIFWSEIKDGRHLENLFSASSPKQAYGSHLENLFCPLSSEPKGQLNRNFVGSIGATFRLKVTKILCSEIQDGRYSDQLKNLSCASSLDSKRPIDSKLGRKCWSNKSS